MFTAKLKCSKVPIICTNQTGRAHEYCNGLCECNYQVAVIEYEEARLDIKESPVNSTAQSGPTNKAQAAIAICNKLLDLCGPEENEHFIDHVFELASDWRATAAVR